MKCLMAIFIALGIGGAVNGATHCVRVGAVGSADGSDWNNAFTALPATLNRGDTYYIADGSYSGYTFDDAPSGTTLITVKKAIESDHGPSTGWSSAYGDGSAEFSTQILFSNTAYYLIDGQVGSKESGYGFRREMQSGDGIKGIRFNDSNFITIKHFDIDGNNHTGSSGDGIYSITGMTDNTFSFVRVYGCSRVLVLMNGGARCVWEWCWLERPNANAGQHSEIFSVSDPAVDDCIIRYSYIIDPISTGGIMIEGSGWKIYGNVITSTEQRGTSTLNNGIIGGWSANPSTGHIIVNNTFVDINWTDSGGGKLFPIEGGETSGNQNNIHFNTTYDSNCATNSHNAFGPSVNPGESNQQTGIASSKFVTYGSEYFQKSTDNFALASATTAGATLAEEFKYDGITNFDGTLIERGTDGTWDRGAFEFQEGGGTTGGNGATLSSGVILSNGVTVQ